MKTRFAAICAALILMLAVPAIADLPAQSVLDGLKGKKEVLVVTTHDGTQMLGRVLSGDHGQYVVQTFHYVTAPFTVPQTTAQTTYKRGRGGRLYPQTKQTTTRVTTRSAVPDAAALRALLSGVTGPSFRPTEQAASREIVAATEVQTVQALLPPSGTPGAAKWTLKALWPVP